MSSGMGRVGVGGNAAKRALELYLLGHRDMIDNMLYSAALEEGLLFLTIDSALLEFLEENGLPRGHVVTPEELGRSSGV